MVRQRTLAALFGSGVAVAGLALAVLAQVLFSPGPAAAISASSREYEAECTTCHTIYPQRNEFGQAFEKNDFVWPGASGTAERAAKADD